MSDNLGYDYYQVNRQFTSAEQSTGAIDDGWPKAAAGASVIVATMWTLLCLNMSSQGTHLRSIRARSHLRVGLRIAGAL